MKFVLCLFVVVLTLSAFQGVAQAGGGSMELYSWKDKDGNWLYVLTPGTNAQKSENDVKNQKPIKGTAELKKKLALLGAGEHVMWSEHRLPCFDFPPEETRNEIAQVAKDAKIDFIIDLDSSIEPSLIKDKVDLTLGEEFSFEFKRDGNRLVEPTKVKATDTKNKKSLVNIQLGKTDASPFPPPRAGATRPFLSVDNNFDRTLRFRVLLHKKDPKNPHYAAFDKLSNDVISLPAGEAMIKCWSFDTQVEEVILYDFQLADDQP